MTSAYQAARQRAAFIERSSRGRLLVSGSDRASYLQGLLTNDTVALKAGEGCYAAYLTPQGRMISDLLVYELGDVILLSLPGDVKDTVLARLDQFIFSEDVQLGDVTATFGQVVVVGPDALVWPGQWWPVFNVRKAIAVRSTASTGIAVRWRRGWNHTLR